MRAALSLLPTLRPLVPRHCPLGYDTKWWSLVPPTGLSSGAAMMSTSEPRIGPRPEIPGPSSCPITGFSALGGIDTKLKLLAIERAKVGDAQGQFDDLGGLPIGLSKT